MKALQQFSPESLERCKDMSPQQIAEFLEGFRQMFVKAQPDNNQQDQPYKVSK